MLMATESSPSHANSRLVALSPLFEVSVHLSPKSVCQPKRSPNGSVKREIWLAASDPASDRQMAETANPPTARTMRGLAIALLRRSGGAGGGIEQAVVQASIAAQ